MSHLLQLRKIVTITLLCFCFGCESEGLSDLKNEVASFKRHPLPTVASNDFVLGPQTFSYGAADKPCPFTQMTLSLEKGHIAALPAMKQVGSVDKNGKSWVLLEDDKGSIHVVSGENYMNKQQQKNG